MGYEMAELQVEHMLGWLLRNTASLDLGHDFVCVFCKL